MKKLFLLTAFMLCMSAAFVKAVEAPPSGYVSLYSLTYQTLGQTNMTGTVVAAAASAQMVGPAQGWGDGIHYYNLSRYDTLAIKLTFDTSDAGKQVAARIKWDLEGVGPTIITYPAKDSPLLTSPTETTRSYVYKLAMTKQRMGGMVFYNGASHWSFTYPGVTAKKAVTIDYIAVRTTPITGVNLIDSVAKVEIGKTKSLMFALIPARATNDTLVWSSKNTSVATVANGVVTAVAKGTAWIKATSVVNSTFADSCLVTVTPYPSNFESLYAQTYVNTISYVQADQTGLAIAAAASAQMVGPANGWGDGDKYYDISKFDTLAIKLVFDTADMGKQVAARIKWDLEGVSPTIITYPTDSTKSTFVNSTTRSYVYKMAMTKQKMGGMVFYNGASHWSFTYPGVAAKKAAKIDYIAIQKVIATAVKVAALDTAMAAALPLGKTTSMKAMFSPVVKNNSVTWMSMDTTVATVNASGLVTAIKVGTTNIKATSVTFPTLSATYAVNAVFIPVASLAITDSIIPVEIGKTKALDYSLLPLNATNAMVAWSTSDTTVAKVANGVVTALKLGTAKIKVRSLSDSTKMDSCIVKVNPFPSNFESLYSKTYVNTVAFNQADMTGTAIAAAASSQMVGPSNGWGDGDKYYDISKYDTLAIKLTFDTADMGKQVAARIKWDLEGVSPTIITYPTDSTKLTFVNATTRSYVFKMAMTKQRMGGMVFYNGASHWSFTYPGVAAKKAIKIDYVAIQTVVATGVKVAPLDSALAAALPLGKTTTLKPVFTPVAKNNSVTWLSMDTTVATVNASGLVTAIKVGTVSIKATSVTFPTLSASYPVNVVFVPVAGLAIVDSAVVIEIGKTKALDYALLPANATNAALAWSTSDTTVAKVANGVVTALKNGTAKIKVISLSDSTKMDSCFVKVVPYPTNFESLYSLKYVNTVSYNQADMTGTAIAGLASAQMVGPLSGWGDGDKYYDVTKYDTLAIKLTFDTADMGKQVAARFKWDLEGVSPTFITYPTDSTKLTVVNDSTRSFVYKMAMPKMHMGGMVFYNGATHWSFTYTGVAAKKAVKIDYIAIQTITATGVKVAAMDSVLAAALPGKQSTTLKAVFAPVVKNNLVTWASSDTTIAVVDAKGVVTARTTVGTVTITATSVSFPTLSATYTVIVIPEIIVSAKTIQQDNQNELVNVYSISGILVRRAVKVSEATLGLNKGIYIVGNKKVSITK